MIALVASCSITDILPIGEKPKIEANVAIGKTNTQDKNLVSIKGEDKRQIADEISNTETTNFKGERIENITVPWWAVLIGVLTGILVMPIELVRQWRQMKRDTA